MLSLVIKHSIHTVRNFWAGNDGLALTEYLLLLGLITAGIITAVLGFGDSLTVLWEQWATFMAAFETAASVPTPDDLGAGGGEGG